ncbi:efflux RND transporter permease subunit [Nitrospira sp. T9]|uniref:efflux RND transporter permease subunit n=1 Tax=unclassified Nitrospira TaxID=2652172 RepID=UPI003F9E0C77
MSSLIDWSLQNRLLVLFLSVVTLVTGVILARSMPVDVFPNLTAPTVTILTEAASLAPEEVETLVTLPIETVMNGATGVRRVRSVSSIGFSIVWIEFDWGTDVYRARQIISEKLQLVGDRLPPEVRTPVLAPISSIMGEILFLGVRGPDFRQARTLADWEIRRRLLVIPGVAQVIPIGGNVKQYQVLVSPQRLQDAYLSLSTIARALTQSNSNATGGFLLSSGQEHLVRGIGRIHSLDDIRQTVVDFQQDQPILIGHVADVRIGNALTRGEGSVNGEPAVVMAILKQPEANTLTLTHHIDRVLDEIEPRLPVGFTLDRSLFRQSDFIQGAIQNVVSALRDGALLVVIVLFIFLLNIRATFISVLAIPLSLAVALLGLKLAGVTINTMTLGGLTIAVGLLADDAIVFVDNIVRRLKQEQDKAPEDRQSLVMVVQGACAEVTPSIMFATFIIMLVMLPLFFLGGVEGRLLWPLGYAYLLAVFASLLVAVTVTPVLSTLFLQPDQQQKEGWVVNKLLHYYQKSLTAVLGHPNLMLGLAALLLLLALAIVPWLGRTFLPPFNEGTLTVNIVTLPGTSLFESDRIARLVEETLLSHPEVVSTARRTGRAELDEHAEGVNSSELDVMLRMQGRSKEAFLEAVRESFRMIPGITVNIGQPISHRIDHMLSGTRSAIAVKLFGPDLYTLRQLAKQVEQVMKPIPGVVDLAIDQQTDIPLLTVAFNRSALASHGLSVGEANETLQTALKGRAVTQVLEGQRAVDLIVRYADEYRKNPSVLASTLIDTPGGNRVPLSLLATIYDDYGPNKISRENVQRKMVVACNVAERDLGSVVEEIQHRITSQIQFPPGYYITYGGQFESQQEATRRILLISLVVLVGMIVLLYQAFSSFRLALLILVNLPLALVGGVVAIALTDGVLSVASLVGFITLFGIAIRNGILLIARYQALLAQGMPLHQVVREGSLDRLTPILMTALVTVFALIPLALGQGQPGSEIQSPLAIVILGGLLSATFLNLYLLPVLFVRYGIKETVRHSMDFLETR